MIFGPENSAGRELTFQERLQEAAAKSEQNKSMKACIEKEQKQDLRMHHQYEKSARKAPR